eukprot:5745749-Amphidinium_carterae.1
MWIVLISLVAQLNTVRVLLLVVVCIAHVDAPSTFGCFGIVAIVLVRYAKNRNRSKCLVRLLSADARIT